ncbi:MAG TPA: vWA domain-containing protein [Ktedonobacteraceae bacterium]|nr:vWA domain-containing protein [Ktedonobacteraceae bacterium]
MQKREKRVYPPRGGHHPIADISAKPVKDDAELLRRIDLCVVMDATGSMQNYIDAARQELKNFASALSTHSLRPRVAYGLVLYRDHPPQDTSFVTQLYPLSENINDIQRALDTAKADGGGDGPEAVIDGLYDAVHKLEWRKGAHKVVMLAGDAPPHGVGDSGDSFPRGCPCGHTLQAITSVAKEKGVIIFCLGIGEDSFMRRSFQQTAIDGGGKYVSLNNANTLIDEVMSLVKHEFSNVEIDRLVYSGYKPDLSASSIASTIGLSIKQVEDSIIRLRRKEMI